MSLGQPHALFIPHQIAVKVRGRRKTERPLQQDLPRGRLQQIAAAHDFGDPHLGIVDDASQLIARQTVFSPYQKIAKVRAGIASSHKRLRAGVPIDEMNDFSIRYAKTVVHAL